MSNDLLFMQRALQLAELAEKNNEVPVGAVVVLDNKIIGEGSNAPISHCNPTEHAEMIALRNGSHTIGNYRLLNSTLYVTLEPCVMCVGALVHARVKRVVFGAYDKKAGAVESVFCLGQSKHFNHHIMYEGGLLESPCRAVLQEFFQKRRSQKKAKV